MQSPPVDQLYDRNVYFVDCCERAFVAPGHGESACSCQSTYAVRLHAPQSRVQMNLGLSVRWGLRVACRHRNSSDHSPLRLTAKKWDERKVGGVSPTIPRTNPLHSPAPPKVHLVSIFCQPPVNFFFLLRG